MEFLNDVVILQSRSGKLRRKAVRSECLYISKARLSLFTECIPLLPSGVSEKSRNLSKVI